MVNPTKITRYDLDTEIGDLLTSLIAFKGSYNTLQERLMDLTSDTFSDKIQTVIDDLVSGYDNSSVLTIQRVINATKYVDDQIKILEDKLYDLSFDMGNYTEIFTYDATSGNVTKHEVTGDKAFTIDYNYTNLANGILNTSVQKFKNKKGQNVTLTKTYTYDGNGNITQIATATVVDTTPPAEVSLFNVTSPSAGQVNCTWVTPVDPDFDHVEIYTDTNTTASYTSPNKTASSTSITGVPAGTHTFIIKTVDTSGNKSTGYLSASVTVS